MSSSIRTLYPWVVGALLLGAAVAGVLLWVKAESRPGIEVLLPTPSPTPDIQVYVSGAVANPGVYELKEGDRLDDALEAAGGPQADADLAAVNLALRIVDEDHFDIPRIGEAPVADTTSEVLSPQRIDINSASSKLLESLPQIGEGRATAIVAYREQNGRFEAPEDIMRVSGIGLATFAAIRELITVR